jgi:hypothetical protein
LDSRIARKLLSLVRWFDLGFSFALKHAAARSHGNPGVVLCCCCLSKASSFCSSSISCRRSPV